LSSVHDRDADTDRESLRRARSEPEAFGVFYRRHVDWVLAFLARRVNEPEVVADLAAESFAAALIGSRRIDVAEIVPNAWLFGIVNNQLNAYLRRGKISRRAQMRLAIQRVGLDDRDLAHIESLAGDTVAVEILEQLPTQQRVAVRRRVIDERGYNEIADELGVTEATVRKRVSRGLAALRSQLNADRHV
jgi:RNA polymerase sigma factor (sigma-70 family)